MNRHHRNRHLFAVASFGAISASLLPALASITTSATVLMQRAAGAMSGHLLIDEIKLPDLPSTISQLQKSRQMVSDMISEMRSTDGPTELMDFKVIIDRLQKSGITTSDSKFLITMETHGHIAAYEQLLAVIDQHLDDASALSEFKPDNVNQVMQLGVIGRRAVDTQMSFWALGTVNVESWLEDNTVLSILPKPADEKQPIAA